MIYFDMIIGKLIFRYKVFFGLYIGFKNKKYYIIRFEGFSNKVYYINLIFIW